MACVSPKPANRNGSNKLICHDVADDTPNRLYSSSLQVTYNRVNDVGYVCFLRFKCGGMGGPLMRLPSLLCHPKKLLPCSPSESGKLVQRSINKEVNVSK